LSGKDRHVAEYPVVVEAVARRQAAGDEYDRAQDARLPRALRDACVGGEMVVAD